MSVSSSTTSANINEINAAEHAKRLAEARNVSRRYALVAASLALLPLPVLDFAAILALQVKMVHELSKLYNVSFNYREVRPLLFSVLSGFAVSGSGILLISIGMTIPGLGTLVGGGLAGSLSASTLATGEIFIRHFETGGTLEDIQQSQIAMLPSSKVFPLTNVGDTSNGPDNLDKNTSIFMESNNNPIALSPPAYTASNNDDFASAGINFDASSNSENQCNPVKINVARIYGIGSTYQRRLHLAGIDDCEALSKLDSDALCTILGQRVSLEIANEFISQAKELIKGNSS